jgi:hypothetical protein
MLKSARKSLSGLTILLLIFFSDLCLPQAPEDRIAIIIGNSNYPKNSELKNPINDAKSIELELKKLGFETHIFIDLKVENSPDIRQLIEKRVRRNSVLFFYYAGHGLQIEGRNYLIPITSRTQNTEYIAEDSLYLGDILGAIEKKRPKLAAVILDACRDNPFKYEDKVTNKTKGLARVDPPTSTVVFYATRPGGIADDGSDNNGLFTKSLLDEIKKPDQPIEVIFRKTSTKVFDISKSEQEPWVEGVIRQEFYISRLPKPVENIQPNLQTTILSSPQNITQSPSQTPIETTLTQSLNQESEYILRSLSSDEMNSRLRAFEKDSELKKDLNTSFICVEKGCFDYKSWVKTLNNDEELSLFINELKKFNSGSTPIVCEFNLAQNKCKGPAPKITVIYPLALFHPSFVFGGFEFKESKVTSGGNLNFTAKPVLLRGSTRLNCLDSDGGLKFSNESINLDISSQVCFNLVVMPGVSRQVFKIAYIDIPNRKIVARWDFNLLAWMAFGFADSTVELSY